MYPLDKSKIWTLMSAYRDKVFEGTAVFLLCHYKCSIQLSPAYPTLHYAYNSMPSILEPYNPMVPSNVCTTINNHHQYFETSVGRVLQDLNSETGVLRSAFKQLVETSQKCPGCLCQFSRDGYMGHLGLNENSYHCLNTPGCPIGKLKHLNFRPHSHIQSCIQLRCYHRHYLTYFQRPWALVSVFIPTLVTPGLHGTHA